MHQLLTLCSSNHVNVIASESSALSTEKIKPPTISLATEVTRFYNEKSAMKFDNTILVPKKIFFTFMKLVKTYIIFELDNWAGYPAIIFQ